MPTGKCITLYFDNVISKPEMNFVRGFGIETIDDLYQDASGIE